MMRIHISTRALPSLVVLLALSGCATSPLLSVHTGDERRLTLERHANALASGVPSESTRIALRRYDVLKLTERSPAEAIAYLHGLVASDQATPDLLFALTELSFLHASRTAAASRRARRPSRPEESARAHYLAAAVYAWAFLFDEWEGDAIAVLDPRAAIAAALYNRAVAAAFSPTEGRFDPRAGRYPLPFGVIEVGFDSASLAWGQRRLTAFQPAARFKVRGLRNRYRQPGIGAPLLASAVADARSSGLGDLGLSETVVSATAVLAIDAARAQLQETSLDGRLSLYRGREKTSLEIEGRRVPLEIEPSVALAATLERSGVWQGELAAFLGRAVGVERKTRLFALEPMQPRQTPVVFVHGTNSNPAVWANMANDLLSHPLVREHFSFWFFAYDSGNPILHSAMMLRRSLSEIVAYTGVLGAQACLGDMVVVGHSQGGLLTKLTAIDSGTRLWDNAFRKPFEQVRLRPETRTLLREAVFVEPLPFVSRVVFIATPHRGSFLASPRIVRRIASRLIHLPLDLADIGTDLAGVAETASAELRVSRMATSLDNMSPSNPFIRTLAEIPVAAGVAQNSIVAVRGDGPPEGGGDGVVRFSSAHVPDAESELVVRSGHSTQSNPHTVNEVERILRLHAGRSTCAGGG